MNENQNPNLGNTVDTTTPGPTPNPVNPNMATAPANTVSNPNIMPTVANNTVTNPVATPEPAPTVTPVAAPAPNVSAELNQAPINNAPVPPINNTQMPGMNAGGLTNPLPGMAPNVNPTTPVNPTAPNVATPEAPVEQPTNGITIDPNVMNNITPAPSGGPTPDNKDTKRFDTKTIILVVAAILSVIIAVVYFVFLREDKKPAPIPNPNANTNLTQNTANNTIDNTVNNVIENTTPEPEPEPEPEKIDKYDMSWMGSYSNEETNITINYTAPGIVELNIAKSGNSNAGAESVTLNIESLETINFSGEYLGNELNIALNKTANGIAIKAECSDENSIFNLEEELSKDKLTQNGWSGFYQTEGGQIIINEIYDKGGKIDITADDNKYKDLSTSYELRNDTITIKSKSFSKDDTKIKKDGDKLIVTSDEYLEGTYEKLSE